jgi:hypothetical protein
MRGQGHGKAVWNAGMARLAGRTVGLDGVAAQLANYRRKGFRPAYETIRFSGRSAIPSVRSDAVRAITAQLVPDIIAYDAHCFPAPRRAFLERWSQPPHVGVAATSSLGTIGYAVARPCRSGYKIGPLFADDTETAMQLLGSLAGACEGGDLHIDVPAGNIDFTAVLAAIGFTPTFSTTRMYKGPPPKVDSRRTFGVTTLELG